MQRENNTKRAARQSRQTPPKRANDQRDTNGRAARVQGETDYMLTSQERVVRKKAPAPAHFVLKRFLSGKTLKQWRKEHGYSAQALAVELGVSRAYIKSIEGGSLPASQKLIERFNALREKLGEGGASPAQDVETPRRVISRYALPQSFEILARPVKCKTCHAFFVGRTPKQKYCGARCAKLGRKAQRTKRATKKRAHATAAAAKRAAHRRKQKP